jgi:hypothetical protein
MALVAGAADVVAAAAEVVEELVAASDEVSLEHAATPRIAITLNPAAAIVLR